MIYVVLWWVALGLIAGDWLTTLIGFARGFRESQRLFWYFRMSKPWVLVVRAGLAALGLWSADYVHDAGSSLWVIVLVAAIGPALYAVIHNIRQLKKGAKKKDAQ